MAEGNDRQFGDLHAGTFFGHGMENGATLRTDGQAVAGILHIAAREEISLRRQQCAANLEARVGRVGLCSGSGGGFEEGGRMGHKLNEVVHF